MLIFSVVIFVFSTLTLSPVPLCLEKWGVMTPQLYGIAAPVDTVYTRNASLCFLTLV